MGKMEKYDHKKIEKKWQKIWAEKKIFRADDFSEKEKFFALVEFPYPSGAGLHVGHVRSYAAMDILCRKKRMEGRNVMYPIGWDAFGLPTENFAIKNKIHPRVATDKNIANFRRQLKNLGISFDWSREIDTTDPKYFRWTQKIFLKFFEKGLAYKKKMPINWCPSCKIGLANEEVISGKCERCGAQTIKKEKSQWMLAITKFAERLADDLDGSNVFVFHGFGANARSNFFPQIEKFCREKKIEVFVPNFPRTEKPKFSEWKNFFEKNFADKIRSNSIFICHSLGAQFAIRFLREKNLQIEKLILVAPAADDAGISEISNFFEK